MPLRSGRVIAGIAGVPETAAVLGPGHRSAGGRVLHAWNRLAHLLAGGGVIDVQGPVLAAALGQGHGDQAAVWRGHIPVDGGEARGIEQIGVQQGPAAGGIGQIAEHDQGGLLARGIAIEGEDVGASGLQVGIGGSGGGDQPGQVALDRLADPQGVQAVAGALVLGLGPADHQGIAGVFQPAVGLGDGDAVDHLGERARRRIDGDGVGGLGLGRPGDATQSQGGAADRTDHERLPERLISERYPELAPPALAMCVWARPNARSRSFRRLAWAGPRP